MREKRGRDQTQNKNREEKSHLVRQERAFPGGAKVKNSPAVQETYEAWVRSLGWEDALEEGMGTHSSILAWRIPWTEGARRTTVHGVTKNRTRLMQLSTHARKEKRRCLQ